MPNGPSAAVRLLGQLLEFGPGRVFTSHEAVTAGADLGIGAEHVYKLLSELVDRDLLERPRGHLYVMRPPFGGMVPVRPLAIAVRAVIPAAVSGDTARAHWGLLSQAPLHEETVSTPARIQWAHGVRRDGADRLWTLDGSTIRFLRVRGAEMFGIVFVRLDSETVVPMFDRERSIAELLSPRAAGERAWAAELIQEHRRTIDHARLDDYLARLGATAERERLLPALRRTRGRRVLT